MNFDFNIFAGQPGLPTLGLLPLASSSSCTRSWTVLTWVSGMLMGSKFAKNEKERRLFAVYHLYVWDGNEVWIESGGAAIFAAFPIWYLAPLLGSVHPPDPRAGLP